MKTLFIVTTLVALAAAMPAEDPKPQESTKQKRGLLELAHGPALLPAPILAKSYAAPSYATPIIHAGPVVTKVFDAPAAPFVRSLGEPYITGPLITRGIGPHIYGAKTILPAPILKAAPYYAAPIYSKSILAHAPIISYAPKLAAPIAYGHGYGW